MPTVRLKKNPNGLYYVIVYDRTRLPKAKSIPTGTRVARYAESERRRVEREVFEGRLDPWAPRTAQAPKDRTFEGAARAFLDARSHLRAASIKAYQGTLVGVGVHLPPGIRVDGLTATHLRPYVLDKTVSDATRRHRHRNLRVFFRWCIESGLCGTDPMKQVRLPKAVPVEGIHLSPAQVQTLVAAIEAEEAWWLRDVVLFALTTGLRRGEVVALRWSGVCLDQGDETIAIRSGEHGFETKNGRHLTRALFGDALAVVRRRFEARPENAPDGPVFTSAASKALSADYVTQRFKRYVRQAGLPGGVHFHTLRHTHASWLVRAGTPLPIIQKMLGHSSIYVTQIYTHADVSTSRAYGRAAFES